MKIVHWLICLITFLIILLCFHKDTEGYTGWKDFKPTIGMCIDAASERQSRFLYFNMSVPKDKLIPVTITEIDNLDSSILAAGSFSPPLPNCTKVTLKTSSGLKTHFVATDEVKLISPCDFDGNVNTVTNVQCP